MTARIPRPLRTLGRVRQSALVLWAGIAIGVAFLATPAKFLAPSLSLPDALDVGRATFAVYNRAELGLLALLLLIGAASRAPWRWYFALAVPGSIVLLQAAWLIPALDDRVTTILAGGAPPADSNLHGVYIAAELTKIAALIVFGLRPPERFRGGGVSSAPGHRANRAGVGPEDGYEVPRGWRAMPRKRDRADAFSDSAARTERGNA
jgi:hypothetical protein